MEPLNVLILAIIQGITEFLPISSSAHLILPSKLFGLTDQGLLFDVAVHFGTLLAVMLYFRQKIGAMICSVLGQAKGQPLDADGRLAWQIVLATMPAVIVGFIVNLYFEEALRQVWIIAVTTIVFGLLLWWADSNARSDKTITLKIALLIGLAQCLALIPGVSRSGITMTMALLLGVNRHTGAEFSFLLSIPLILAATLLKLIDCLNLPSVDWSMLALGVAASAISAYLCIHWFLAFIEKIGFLPFVIYRLLLGALLLFLII
ncbi:MAG: undecaprenyl-diphosphate phosphatase [Cellvibrionales bacterium]|nr:undecaprenyl-diphosphate phosphatase [Cellvibrionales bacterium]